MKLTIILTVYNKEPFLCRAFDALLTQIGVNVDDYEVLVVNDGSTDGSGTIINDIVKRSSIVRVLYQENQGLSMARNNGIKEAKGEYVWFVDADDIISKDAVRLICEAAYFHPDVIPIYAQTSGVDCIRNKVDRNAKTGREVLLGAKWEQCGVFNVFRRSFLLRNELRFMPGIYHEDAEFTPRALYAANTIKVVPKVLYTVYRDPNSITQVPRPKRAFDYLTVAESLSRFVIDNNEISTPVGRMIDDSAALCVNNALHIIKQNSSAEQESFNFLFNEKKEVLLRSLLYSLHRKYHVEAVMLKLFPKHSIFVYKALKLFV